MKRITRKMLSAFLAVAMILSLSVSALADLTSLTSSNSGTIEANVGAENNGSDAVPVVNIKVPTDGATAFQMYLDPFNLIQRSIADNSDGQDNQRVKGIFADNTLVYFKTSDAEADGTASDGDYYSNTSRVLKLVNKSTKDVAVKMEAYFDAREDEADAAGTFELVEEPKADAVRPQMAFSLVNSGIAYPIVDPPAGTIGNAVVSTTATQGPTSGAVAAENMLKGMEPVFKYADTATDTDKSTINAALGTAGTLSVWFTTSDGTLEGTYVVPDATNLSVSGYTVTADPPAPVSGTTAPTAIYTGSTLNGKQNVVFTIKESTDSHVVATVTYTFNTTKLDTAVRSFLAEVAKDQLNDTSNDIAASVTAVQAAKKEVPLTTTTVKAWTWKDGTTAKFNVGSKAVLDNFKLAGSGYTYTVKSGKSDGDFNSVDFYVTASINGGKVWSGVNPTNNRLKVVYTVTEYDAEKIDANTAPQFRVKQPATATGNILVTFSSLGTGEYLIVEPAAANAKIIYTETTTKTTNGVTTTTKTEKNVAAKSFVKETNADSPDIGVLTITSTAALQAGSNFMLELKLKQAVNGSTVLRVPVDVTVAS